ncbi:MAG: M15 family metallopeptidase [Clostridia bacterium]|nr:M15 family metallopeptidase [Clostridia bacterium]
MKKHIAILTTLVLLLGGMPAFAGNGSAAANEDGIDYLALVNKLHPLPEGWEEALETVMITNSVGDEVEVEAQAYAAYLSLKTDLEENDGIYLELDSARRSVAAQQDIMNRFIEKYGADYAAKTVATPGYSEHHTGLALDLYFKIKNGDGTFTDVYYNEDMTRPEYEELWAKVHAKLADYGFILRYLPDKEYITGYGYEPWHIRYIGDADLAREITAQPGKTLEVWLGAATDANAAVDYGTSELYTRDELEEAAVQVKCRFASFAGCELHTLRYAGDECNTEENIAWMNQLDEGKGYVQAAEFISDFHSPVQPGEETAWEPDTEYTDWQWWLARTADGGWQLLTWGYR